MLDNLIQTELFDKFIDCTFVTKDKRIETISTTDTGIKPLIKFTWSRVPGQFTYKCRLEITNWFTNTPWYDYDSVTVVAGYKYLKAQSKKFTVQIFNSYKNQGGPDTPAIFEGIVAQTESNLLLDAAYLFKYYDTSTTVKDVLNTALSKLGFTTISLNLAPWLLELPFSTKQIEESFSTGNQLLRFLDEYLKDVVKHKNENINMVVFDTYCAILHYDTKGQIYPTDKESSAIDSLPIPVLDNTTDVTWTAGTLSIVAPWNPAIEPGHIFYCEPRLYTGTTALPNIVARQNAHKDPTNCYYVVTQKVSFGTTGNTNTMEILAVRMSSSPAMLGISATASLEQAESENEQYKQEFASYIATLEKILETKKLNIVFGTRKPVNTHAVWKQSWSPSATEDVLVKPGDTIFTVASTKFKGHIKAVSEGKLVSILALAVGAPLTIFTTYSKYIQSKDTKYEFIPTAPSTMPADGKHYFCVPSISDYTEWNNDTKLASLLRALADEYGANTFPECRQELSLLASCVEEGTIYE